MTHNLILAIIIIVACLMIVGLFFRMFRTLSSIFLGAVLVVFGIWLLNHFGYIHWWPIK